MGVEVGELEGREAKEEADGNTNSRDHRVQAQVVTPGVEERGQMQDL